MTATVKAAVRLGRRSTLVLVVAAFLGVVAFCWPLLVDSEAALAEGGVAPWFFALLLPVALAVVLSQVSDGGLDPKAIALLGVLSALGAAVRPLGGGTAGIETVFFVIVLGGRVFGPGFGFVQGCTTLLASALLTGGVGPWLPYQMVGAAFVGLGAGLLPRCRGRLELLVLAVYGACAGLLYGVLLNLSFWPFSLGEGTGLSFVPGDSVAANLHRFLGFTLATSLGWDVGRAITTVVLVVATGPVLLRVLRRAARRAAFTASGVATPPRPRIESGSGALAAAAVGHGE